MSDSMELGLKEGFVEKGALRVSLQGWVRHMRDWVRSISRAWFLDVHFFPPLAFDKDRKSGRTALHLAAEEANLELIRLFLELPSCLSFVNAKVLLEAFKNCTRVGITFFIPSLSFWAAFMQVSLPDGCHFVSLSLGLQWKHRSPCCCQPAISGDTVGCSPPVDEEGSRPKYSELGERTASAFGSWWPCGRTGEGHRRQKKYF